MFLAHGDVDFYFWNTYPLLCKYIFIVLGFISITL